MKKIILDSILSLCFFTVFSCGNSNSSLTNQNQGVKGSLDVIENDFFNIDTLKQIPNNLQVLIKGEIIRVLKVDFNGDDKSDFICQYKPIANSDNADYLEDWITSDNKIFKTEKKYFMDFDFLWFVNLDNDSEPEIFSATGYEDGIDYAFYDQNLKTGNNSLLFYFNPVILENGKHYWGYPWDIKDIILKRDSTNVYIKSSIDNDIERDGNITIPKTNKQFPAIFFTGHSTQPNIKVEDVRNIKWMTLDELK